MDEPHLQAIEAEFLPAALSLQRKPVSPAGRWVARILMLMCAAICLWSIFGRIDIVVNAQGRIIPTGHTKTIAAIETARVSAIHVQEGQMVKAGDVLMELDSRTSDSEHAKADGARRLALLQLAGASKLIWALDSHHAPHLDAMRDVPAEELKDADEHLSAQWKDYLAKSARLDDEIHRYLESLPLVTQRASDYKILSRQQDVTEHAWQEKEQARIDLQAQLDDARDRKTALLTETRKSAEDAREQAQKTLNDSTQDAIHAQVHSEWLKLISPVDGTVQHLAVHTLGGVVAAAQPLMQIVPQNPQVEMEVFIENKDVGFVHEGQVAAVKIDTFEYTKYGTISALVNHVSRDAIQQPDDGDGAPPRGDGKANGGLLKQPAYLVNLVLKQTALKVDGKEVQMTPGMAGSVEIRTGTRRVFEYLLAPLMQYGRESMHER
ncbi:MAG: HlyD family type I secretion periplasmic adaptor subunit [Burkholderiaceae bacterium]|nr:HlyD family type I secretion periplasmic adaptor subunit [Burkholderiaceae bacterium]